MPTKYENVPAEPVKSFFVDMLTRDISLSDAVLDLLDNCVDGIIRSDGKRKKNGEPYDGFSADISFDRNSFSIIDNCGGIPWRLHKYAFRMGNAKPDRDNDLPTVGTYGIGMKRAIFKIGQDCDITTQSGQDAYQLTISPQWMKEEDNWDIPVQALKKKLPDDGTRIVIRSLRPGVKSLFHEDRQAFEKELRDKIETHYAFIIDKGFSVTLNGVTIKPLPTKLRFDEGGGRTAIRPFIYKNRIGSVDVFLAVGFTQPIPSAEEVAAEQQRPQYSSLSAGWTVVCNDRAVVYCDRSELTGWGEAGVPKYHTQFTSIAGIVEFRSNSASELPTTTTKRGIDASSKLYLQVKNKMREGMQIFTDFTNRWKGKDLVKDAQAKIQQAAAMTLDEIKSKTTKMTFHQVRTSVKGEQFKPQLPVPPKRDDDLQRISFSKTTEEIHTVAKHLFGTDSTTASRVGEKCFDVVYREASR